MAGIRRAQFGKSRTSLASRRRNNRPGRFTPGVVVATSLALSLSLFSGSSSWGADGSEPALDIVTAVVSELPPIDFSDAANRTIVFEILLAGPPPSPCTSLDQQYGFLIDSDENATTGSSGGLFYPLGVDARVSAICDTGTGTFVNSAGFPVTVSGNNIEIQAPLGLLPSPKFDWIAYAQDDMPSGNVVVNRLPATPDFGHFATMEMSLW